MDLSFSQEVTREPVLILCLVGLLCLAGAVSMYFKIQNEKLKEQNLALSERRLVEYIDGK